MKILVIPDFEHGSDSAQDESGCGALKVALAVKDRFPTSTVTVVALGQASLARSLRHCLAVGADRAICIVDEHLASAEAEQIACVLAAAVAPQSWDVLIFDDRIHEHRAMVPALTAEALGVPYAHDLIGTSADVDASTSAATVMSLHGPTVARAANHYGASLRSTLRGRLRARKKPIYVLSLAELGIESVS